MADPTDSVDAVSGADASAPDAAPPITASDLGSGAAPSQGDEADVRAAMGLQPDAAAPTDAPVLPASWNPGQWDSFVDTSTPQGRAALVQMTPDAATARAPQGQPQPGTQMQQESVSYRGDPGGPGAVAQTFADARQRAAQENANDAQITNERLAKINQDVSDYRTAKQAEIAANVEYAKGDTALQDMLTGWAEQRAAQERQANLQWQAQRQKIVGDYQSQLAAVQQLALSSGNPYESMTKGQAIGLAGAEFAQGFLAAQGVHIDVSGQIDNFVNRSIQEHQQAVQNGAALANDQLHLYDVARESSMDDAEARQRYGGFVVAGLQAQIQANANRYSSSLANARAAQAIAALQIKADQYSGGVIDGYQARANQRMRSEAAAADAEVRARAVAIKEQAAQRAAAARAAVLSGGGQPWANPENSWTDPTQTDANGNERVIAYVNPKTITNDERNNINNANKAFGSAVDNIARLKQLWSEGANISGLTAGRRSAAYRELKRRALLAVDSIAQSMGGAKAAGSSRMIDKFQKLIQTDAWIQQGSNATQFDDLADWARSQHVAALRANHAIPAPPGVYRPGWGNVAPGYKAAGDSITAPKAAATKPAVLEDAATSPGRTKPVQFNDGPYTSPALLSFLDSPDTNRPDRGAVPASEWIKQHGYRQEYYDVDSLASIVADPAAYANGVGKSLADVQGDVKHALTGLHHFAAGRDLKGNALPDEVTRYARHVMYGLNMAQLDQGRKGSTALKDFAATVQPSVPYDLAPGSIAGTPPPVDNPDEAPSPVFVDY